VSLDPFRGILFFITSLLFFLVIQRWLHREMQALFLLLVRRADLAFGLFALVFFPGVLLHEFSHFVMAKILRVPTGRFSLIPQLQNDGILRLGFVETAHVDIVREALIGVAPLVSGIAAISWIGMTRLQLMPLVDQVFSGQFGAARAGMTGLSQATDFWVWFYLCFAVSSTMFPSASDRHGWAPLGVGVLILGGVAWFVGAGPWMAENLWPSLNQGFYFLSLILAISLLVHFILLIPIALLRLLLGKITGLQVV
jgi:hypothetical protein